MNNKFYPEKKKNQNAPYVYRTLCSNVKKLEKCHKNEDILFRVCSSWVKSHKMVNLTIFFLIFRKCREALENTIRPSCNCFERHTCIVMQYYLVANYHYVHVAKCLGGLRTFFMFWLFSENGSLSERTVNRAVIVYITL